MVTEFERIYGLLVENPVFAAFSDFEQEKFIKEHKTQTYAAGSTILTKGAPSVPITFVLRGTASVYHQAEDGRRAVVKLLRAPVLFGEIETFGSLPALESVDAVDEVEAIHVPAETFIKILRTQPDAMWEQLRTLSRAFAVAAKAEPQVFVQLEHRIANYVLSYTEALTKTLDRPPLSHLQIARALGTSVRSGERISRDWEAREYITRSADGWEILLPEKLRSLAGPLRGSLLYSAHTNIVAMKTGPIYTSLLVQCGDPSLVGREFQLKGTAIVGSQPPSTICLPGAVRGQHCRLTLASGQRYFVEDWSGDGDTRLNGHTFHRKRLRTGDTIEVGPYSLLFCQKS